MQAIIGFGANVGDRLTTMRAALARLAKVARVEAVSRVYESDPIGPPQPRFLNAAARIAWDGDALELLDALLAVEVDLGRVRRERWGPRTIDLDVLWIAGLAVDELRLAVPHPHLRERAFAIVPLLELVPDACDPRTREGYAVPEGQSLVVVNASL